MIHIYIYIYIYIYDVYTHIHIRTYILYFIYSYSIINCRFLFFSCPCDARSKSSELLQGPWRGASPEVQSKYAEFFRDHGFEAISGRGSHGMPVGWLKPGHGTLSVGIDRLRLRTFELFLRAVLLNR